MGVDRRKAMKSLTKKGFRKEEESHHIYFHHVYEGKETGVYTYLFFTFQKRKGDW